mmetsp:Transcript_22998/g.38834  ORF Transcript_22998/g.38834 Transcript_22998/m.38834 type:complete len:682 (+) Transcript_22998:1800-3845(+)
MERTVRLWLHRVQHGGAAGHRPGMPMLQLPTGGQDHRVLRVRNIIRRNNSRRCKPRTPIRAWEAIAKHNRLARVFGRQRGVGHRILRLQPVPSDVLQRLHVQLHFREHIRRAGIIPTQPQPFRQFHLNPPVFLRLARRRHRRAAHLDLPVGVGHGAGFLGKGRRRQDHIGIIRRLGDENILHHQVIQLGQRIARMLHIRVRHGRVFAQHIHRLDVARVNVIHDLGDGQTLFVGKVPRSPHVGKGGSHTIIRHRLVIRQEHRDQTCIRRALHVVLTAQRVQTRAGATHLTGHQGQRDQTARIIRAMDVLRHAHTPKDHRRFGPRKGPRHVPQHLGLDAANLCHLLGGKGRKVFLLRLPILGIGVDILLVVEVLFDNRVHDRIQHRHIRAGPELQHMRRETLERLTPRIHHDQLATALGELLEISRRNRVVFDRVAADGNRHIRILDLVKCGRDCARTDILHQRRHGTRMAQPRTVIDIVVAKALTDHLLKQVCFLVCTLGRTKARNLAPAPLHTIRGKVQRLIPGRLAEMGVPVAGIHVQPLGRGILAPDQRLGQAVVMVDIIKAKAALDAKPPLVRRAIDAFDIFDAAVLHLQRNLATHATERANALNFAIEIRAVANQGLIHNRGRHQRPGWTGLHTFAAGHTGAFTHRVSHIKGRIAVMAPSRHANHVIDLNLAAGAHA